MKIFSREELSVALKRIVEDSGLSLFDIDYPTVAAQTLRVYVWRPKPAKQESSDVKSSAEPGSLKVGTEKCGVTLDECACVARQISTWFEQEEVSGSDDWLLEVSSPGVNRRLRLREHFESAVGERVKLTLLLRDSNNNSSRKSIVGKIEGVAGNTVDFSYREDTSGTGESLKRKKKVKRSPSSGATKHLTIELDSIEEARVDFCF